jgi:hypothetical protein
LTTKKDLMALQKDIKAIGNKLEKLIKAVENKPTKVTKVKAVKAKPAKKAPEAPAKKKAVKVTATDQVLNIINKLKKGADTATLMKKTGFNQKKVTNILQRTFKQGKIKRADKGIYVGVK